LQGVKSWKVAKTKKAETMAARELVSASGLPIAGLEDAELWCVKEDEGRTITATMADGSTVTQTLSIIYTPLIGPF